MNLRCTRGPCAVAAGGFSLVELMIAMALSLVLMAVMINVYLYSKNSVRRQDQLGGMQQNVRIAFEYLSNDARMIGHQGCFTRKGGLVSNLGASTLQTNFIVPIEGYEYTVASNAFTLSSNAPADTSTASNWADNLDANGIRPIDPSLISSGGGTGGLTPGSDVLVIRTVEGTPARLSAATAVGASTVAIENVSGGTCSNGTTAKMSGFCTSSYGLIASCANARVFQVGSIAGSTLTIGGNLGTDPSYPTVSTEVFPLQTIVYYVKMGSTGTSPSLYRRIFDGDHATGLEEELIDGVESMQLLYGVDTTPIADGSVDEYRVASAVTDWSTVVAVRMSLLMRAADPLEGDLTANLPTSTPVNGTTITFPTTGSKFDRRAFTTTVAIRNRISYGL